MTKGTLRIVGSGICPQQHLTPESSDAIRSCRQLLYLIPDDAAAQYVVSLASGETKDAKVFYQADKPLADAYQAMIDCVLGWLREGQSTCFALYGHPGVIVYPSHRLLRVARGEGYEASMMPAVSAEDCLFADLGIDPASQGCQTFWATDLLLNRRLLDPSMATVIWSIGVVGCSSYATEGMSAKALLSLLERLYSFYSPQHEVVVYEAATVPGKAHRADAIPLHTLPSVRLDGASTLFIPPALPASPDWQKYAEFEFPTSAATELFQSHRPLVDP